MRNASRGLAGRYNGSVPTTFLPPADHTLARRWSRSAARRCPVDARLVAVIIADLSEPHGSVRSTLAWIVHVAHSGLYGPSVVRLSAGRLASLVERMVCQHMLEETADGWQMVDPKDWLPAEPTQPADRLTADELAYAREVWQRMRGCKTHGFDHGIPVRRGANAWRWDCLACDSAPGKVVESSTSAF